MSETFPFLRTTLYTHFYNPLLSADDQLSPFPSLLRKEGRSPSPDSVIMR